MEYSERVLQLFREKGAYLEGHFLLSSGLHSPNYMQCAKLLQYPAMAAEMGQKLAARFRQSGAEIDLILSPAMGGIIIGHEVARSLDVPFLFSEREDREMKLRRGFQIDPGQKVVIIEDVVTTGKSTKETIALAEQQGAKVTGVGSIVDRSQTAIDFPGIFHTLLKLPLTTYTSEDCPLCRQNIPVIKPGSRQQ